MTVAPQWWRTRFLAAELGLALLMALGLATWCEHTGRVVLDRLLDGNRAAVYGALAAIFGSLLGFVLTSLSIVLGFSGSDALAVVRRSPHYPTLWAVFSAANKALGFATLVALAALFADRDNHPIHVISYLAFFAAVLSAFRLARCIWVLERVVRLVAAQSKTSTFVPG